MAGKIVVTGGSGRLGQHVIRELLDHQNDVLSLDRVEPPAKLCSSSIIDLTRYEDVRAALKGADGVVHLGAYQAPGLVPDPETFTNNVTAVYNLLHATAAIGVRRVDFAKARELLGFQARHVWENYLP
jgi:nucleoside-diphosphate-sugar epimerase